jgi:hypothetical protein
MDVWKYRRIEIFAKQKSKKKIIKTSMKNYQR